MNGTRKTLAYCDITTIKVVRSFVYRPWDKKKLADAQMLQIVNKKKFILSSNGAQLTKTDVETFNKKLLVHFILFA